MHSFFQQTNQLILDTLSEVKELYFKNAIGQFFQILIKLNGLKQSTQPL